MLEEKLSKIGFNKKETKIYLELLRIGPQPVSVIAKRLCYNRTSTYSVLGSLQQKGVVSCYKQYNLKIFVASDPNSLIAYLDSKSNTFAYYKKEFLNLIPGFRAFFKNYNFKKPVVRYFDGLEGVKYVMCDARSSKGKNLSYICLDKWLHSGMKDFLIECKETSGLNKKGSLKAIVPDTEEIRAFFEAYYNDCLTEVLYVNPNVSEDLFENEMTIYDDKVAIIHLISGEEFAVIIESSEIANMQRAIFSMAWKGLEICVE